MRIGIITSEGLPYQWPLLEPFLAKAVAENQGEFTLADVMSKVFSGTWKLWGVEDEGDLVAAAVTEIIEYPQKTAVHMILVAGEGGDKWGDLLYLRLSDYAQCLGADILQGGGRLGFVRKLRHLGFQPVYVVMMKHLTYTKGDPTALERFINE